VQDDFLALIIHGMPGVVPALKTHHHGEMTGQIIDGLAFTLIAPLQSQHHGIHESPSAHLDNKNGKIIAKACVFTEIFNFFI
jgi:hypothetical protein